MFAIVNEIDSERKTNLPATIIQRGWRDYQHALRNIKDRLAKCEKLREACAQRIQCAWRCFKAKDFLEVLRSEKERRETEIRRLERERCKNITVDSAISPSQSARRTHENNSRCQ